MYSAYYYIFGFLALILTIGCASSVKDETPPESPAFELLEAEHTGLQFSNVLSSTKDFNVFHYMYFYNGGGVAVADFNQDGRQDIFFTANMEPNALFLNEGDLKFTDVTETAGLQGMEGWTSGATAVDINQDGLMDIYVSQLGDYRNIKGHNQLYINTGLNADSIPVFEEKSSEYGLDLVGFGTQACFFDYDLDGDLDMFQLNHSVHNNGTFGQRKVFLGTYHETSGDRMFRNDDGRFTEVTKECGIQSSVIGYGLGVSCSDINLDGWPDLYVCNDFHENDYMYINQQNGTFREVLNEQILHTSRFAMGVDIADINNDGYSEIFTLDMHPYDPHILKSSLGEDGYGTFEFKLGYGYNYQYARNMLQLNNRNGTYSEIGLLAGVHATDWSWAALFFDFDHDGNKDLFVSNGIPKRMNNIDYVNFLSNDEVQWRIKTDNMEEADLALEEKMPEIRIPNKFFRNAGEFRFQECREIRNDKPGFSNGAAYADFDNDGDLDVVVNNIGGTPFLYKNMWADSVAGKQAYLHLTLLGSPKNQQAIGARVIAYRGSERLVEENFPTTGYQSSVQPGIHLGLGALDAIDSIHLIWPDRTYQRVSKELCNRQARMAWTPGLPVFDFGMLQAADSTVVQMHDVTSATGIAYTHEENPFIEFDREGLIPHMTSSEGPALAVGDVNGDGLEDVFIGAAKWQVPVLYVQQPDGRFVISRQPAFARDSVHEDVDACFADFDGDGDPDLLVASGGNEFRNDAEALTQRLYLNHNGVLHRDTTAFPDVYLTAACVTPADFDGDGDIDVFMGGRAVPWKYGVIPRSYLWRNDGTGKFEDVTEEVAPHLADCGLVKDAQWADLNGDGKTDLLIAVEWGPVQIFMNTGSDLKRTTLDHSNGFWNFVDVADLDGDGDMDFVAGNLGLNSKLSASRDKPLRLYINDFDDNGQIEQILTYYLGDREIVFPTYAEMTRQLPNLKKSHLFARDFADASIRDLVGAERVEEAELFELYVLENSWFENLGDLKFKRHSLPAKMQFAPLQASLIRDFDDDGALDLLAMGNYYESNIEMGRYDADYGNILFNDGQDLLSGRMQQLKVTGQVRAIEMIRSGDREIIVIARNDAPVLVLQAERHVPDM